MPEKQRRPTVWIVLTGVFAVAAIGLGIWAMNAQSDADDAKEQLTAQEQAASEATPDPAPTEAPTEVPAAPEATVDAATQQAFEDAKSQLGDVSADVEAMQGQIAQAKQELEAAQQKAADASGAVDKLRADAEAFKAQAALSKTCLLGTVGALEQAYQSGGLEAAAQQLKALAGDCREAT
jgi:ABC-type transporter Mla subunit MlaD